MPSPNPYAPTTPGLPDGPEQPFVPQHQTRWDKLLLVAVAILCLVAAPIAFDEIKTIAGSGIVATILGVLLTYREFRCRKQGRSPWPMGLALGLSLPCFSIGLAVIISALGLSPGDAMDYKVHWIVAVFAGSQLLMTIAAYMTLPRTTTSFSSRNRNPSS